MKLSPMALSTCSPRSCQLPCTPRGFPPAPPCCQFTRPPPPCVPPKHIEEDDEFAGYAYAHDLEQRYRHIVANAVASQQAVSKWRSAAQAMENEWGRVQEHMKAKALLEEKRKADWIKSMNEAIKRLENAKRHTAMLKAQYESSQNALEQAEVHVHTLYKNKPAVHICD